MAKVLLTGSRNIISFNVPRESRHTLVRATPIPLARIWRPLDGLGAWLPVRGDYQLIHIANRIPYTDKPFIITFESALPRTFGARGEKLKMLLRRRLVRSNCRRLIAMSAYARRMFLANNSDWSLLNEVLGKLEIIHPNLPLRATRPKFLRGGETLRLVFVGNDFARKGGIVAHRLANKCRQAFL